MFNKFTLQLQNVEIIKYKLHTSWINGFVNLLFVVYLLKCIAYISFILLINGRSNSMDTTRNNTILAETSSRVLDYVAVQFRM